MEITDKYIINLFDGCNFGTTINNSVDLQRELIKKSIRNQAEGYWSGHTVYHILVHGGFIVDGKRSTNKKITALGIAILEND